VALDEKTRRLNGYSFDKVICVRRNGEVVTAADGQVRGRSVLKHSAKKDSRLYQETGFSPVCGIDG